MKTNNFLFLAFFSMLFLFACERKSSGQYISIKSNASDSVKSVRKNISSFDFKQNPTTGNILLSGDSTIAEQYNGDAVEKLFYSSGDIKNIAIPGETIEQQFNHFNKLNHKSKSGVNIFILHVGLNNIVPITEGRATIQSTVNKIQEYINKVKVDCPYAKIIISAMPPCKNRWSFLVGERSPIAQQNWLKLNAAFSELNNIDKFVYGHVKILSDGNGNLDPVYEAINPDTELPDGIHENNDGRKVIIFYWLQAIKDLYLKS